MTLIQTLLTEPPFQALGWALVHFLWQGVLVALLLGGCKRLLRRSTARVRYAVSCLFLLVLLALPVLTFLISMPQEPSDPAGSNWVQTAAAVLLPADESTAPMTLNPSFSESVTPFLPWVVGVWMAGVILLTLRWVAALAYLRRLRRGVSLPVPPDWEGALQNLKRRIAVSTPVRLSVSRLAQAPSVIGWLRPVILLPAAALAGLDTSALEAVLAHELAHIRRHDYLVNLLQAVVDTLLFYHPAVWWVSKQIRIERENCCDDVAAEACGDRVIYARALVNLEQSRAAHTSFALAANGGSLLFRIQRLLRANETDDRRGPSWLSGVAGVVIVALVLAGFYSTARAKGQQAAESEASAEQSSDAPQVLPAHQPSAKTRSPRPSDAQAQFAPRAKAAPEAQQPSPAPEVQPEVASSNEGNTAPAPRPAELAVEASGASEVSDAVTPQAAQPAVASSSRAVESPDFLSGMAAAGYRNLTVDQLIDLKTQGVTPEFARSVQQAGYTDVKPEQLIKLRQHGVDSRFMNEMKADGLGDLSLDDLVNLRSHGVTPDYIAELKDAGYSGLKAGQLTELREHGVDGKYLRGLKAGGLNNLSLEDAVRLRNHGVTPEFIAEMKDAGYTGLKADSLIELRNHGVNGEYVHGMKATGLADLPLADLVRLRDHGVTPDFIGEIKTAGYGGLSAEQYEKLRDNGVNGAYIRRLNQNGLHNLTVEQIIRLRQAGI
jgi:beta-lactamase regulating signal transducer with metallopeptidase domain